MKPFAFSLALASIVLSTSAQTPTTPTQFGTAGTGSGAAASGTVSAPAKPLSSSDKKFVKDVSGAILLEQKYLQLVESNKTATFSEDTTKATGKMSGELKRIWTALATLATAKGAEVAQEVEKNDLAKVQKVGKEKPEKFEKEFFQELGKETKKTSKLLDAAKTLQDAEVKRFAEDWTTVIKGHETAVELAAKGLAKKK